MLEDEAGFGRITDANRCWAALGIRPRVNPQIIREYTYADGAVSPIDGAGDFLILPSMSADSMNLFLTQLSIGIQINLSCSSPIVRLLRGKGC